MSEKTLWTLIKSWIVVATLTSTLTVAAEAKKIAPVQSSLLQRIAPSPDKATPSPDDRHVTFTISPEIDENHGGATTPVDRAESASQRNNSVTTRLFDSASPEKQGSTPPSHNSTDQTTADSHLKTSDEQKNTKRDSDEDDNEVISLNFEKTSLANIVNFLAQRKNINIIPNKDLAAASISLHNYKPLTLQQAWNMLPTLLEINGFTMNKVGNLYRIVSSKESGREPLAIYSSATGTPPSALPETDQMIRYIYFLRNIRAENAQSILSNMFLDRSSVEINRDLDVLFIKEKSLNIKAAMQIIDELDVSGLRQSIEIIQLQYESPTRIASLFTEELLSNKQQHSAPMRFMSLNKTDSSYFSPNVKIMADTPRNSLILIGQDRDIKKIKDFINRFLDIEPTAESRIHTRDIKYLSANNIAQLITNIIKPPHGISKEDLGNNKFFQDINVIAETPGDGRGLYGSGNRVIVTCGMDDWKRIDKLIDKLDRPQAQIAIEVMVVDVTSSSKRDLGAQLRQKVPSKFAGNSLYYGTAMVADGGSAGNPISGSSMLEQGIAGADTTLGANITIGPADNIWAAIRAGMSESNTNIIAQPFFIVANRQQCSSSAGSTQRVAGAFQNVQGLRSQDEIPAKNSIQLTPSINTNGTIDLNISIDFSDFTNPNADPTIGSPRTNRTIQTRASMAEGEVLVLGGLTQTKQVESLYRTPILSSIPVLGNLFKYKVKESYKTNLYAFIRPSIIKPEFNGVPDDYTTCKIDYAKRQVFNFQSYAKSIDPIQQFFFKPRKSSVSEAINDAKSNRFSWIDDFTERRYQPSSVDIAHDPFFQQSESHAQKNKKKAQKNNPRARSAPSE